ncbi:RBP1 [Branchiostoma lanceolatum]|uniref:RBP1 protein n=1 Tax=Branchiostoma lanceolatum TaxID=7740 RepID=A0A8J9Z5R8_BRALA|nr:RBP1 [Branchiostoma lanceolatum]
MAGSSITGKWKLDHNEGFEEFLGEMGAPLLARKAASKTSPTQQIVINGTQVTIKLKSMMITKEMEFNIGQEFETEWSGIKSKKVLFAVLLWWDGCTLESRAYVPARARSFLGAYPSAPPKIYPAPLPANQTRSAAGRTDLVLASGKWGGAMARWEDGRLVVRENGAVGETITSRYIDGNGMLIMQITSPKGLVCRRYFKKKSE